MSKMLNSIQCEKNVLQQNHLDAQSYRKEYSSSMSDDKKNQRRFPPGSLYRRPSEVASTLRLPDRRRMSAYPRLPFQIVSYSIPCERHPLRNEDSFLVDARSGLIAVFDGVGGAVPRVPAMAISTASGVVLRNGAAARSASVARLRRHLGQPAIGSRRSASRARAPAAGRS